MSYRMLLNLLILFLCTGCCACGDECLNYQSFYLRIVEINTGDNIISKYNLGRNDIEIYDDFGQISLQLEGQDENPYLRAFPQESGKTYTIRIEDRDLGKRNIGKIRIFNSEEKTSACCISIKVANIKSVDSNLLIKEKTQESKQPFYEIQF